MDRRPIRRRNTMVARRQPASRRRRFDLDAYYRSEQDDDIYRSEGDMTAPTEIGRFID